MVLTSRAVMTAFSDTLQKRAIFFFISLGRSRSARHSRMSGWIPISSSSLTECWVGLDFSSPAAPMYGTSVRCTYRVFSRPTSTLSWRIASRNGRLSMSPTVPPTSTMTTSTSFATRRMPRLISSVM